MYCAYVCEGHDSQVEGLTRAYTIVSGAESQCWEW